MEAAILFLGLDKITDINWQSFWFGKEEKSFLIEVLLRSSVMFLVILIALRLLGKRTISQLSLFELAVIIALGSATGDPMFYQDVGLLPGITAFLVVVILYRGMTYLVNRFRPVEKTFEGTPTYVVEDGKLNIDNFHHETMAYDEFFAQLRKTGVTHLGQVKYAIIETTGSVSPILLEDDKVKWGLPILPHIYYKAFEQIPAAGMYACINCGQVEEIKLPKAGHECPVCQEREWVEALNELRVK